MSLITASRQSCYCAFCKSPRKVYVKKRIGILDILGSLLGAVALMAAIFREFNPLVFIIFVVFLALSEIFVQLRRRISMTCQHCGFDPILYLKDVPAAVAKVQTRLQSRKEDPSTLLRPPLNIPQRKAEKKPSSLRANSSAAPALREGLPAKGSNKGRMVSRQV